MLPALAKITVYVNKTSGERDALLAILSHTLDANADTTIVNNMLQTCSEKGESPHETNGTCG